MATVFLARDLKHDRPVALKVLHPELAATMGPDRFQREIRLAARLQHPHILTVHDSGAVGPGDGRAELLWFTMPYVEGESLRDRLRRERQIPVEDALRIAREAAQALQYAHDHGVIHRDIKPENLLLTADGSTLVADFGIARALTGEGQGDGQAEARLTETGFAVGTPAYMSPEQSAGERAVDPRSDEYSLAAVLYEMLAGEPPFTGATVQAILMKRISEPAPKVRAVRDTVPDGVDQAIRKALAPAPADRFATVAQFGQALQAAWAARRATAETVAAPVPAAARSATAPAAPARRIPLAALTLVLGLLIGLGLLFAWRRSHDGAAEGTRFIAVLPFENVGDASQEYFADGITDAVRGKLSGVPGIEVIAGRSSGEYKKSEKSLPQIARELGVTHLVTAKIRWAKAADGSSRVQVSPELVQVSADGKPTTRWQQSFDAAMTDVFQVQADVAERVAGELGVALADSARRQLAERPTRNLAAYDLFLRAEGAALATGRGDPQSLRTAIDLYQKAIALDSSFVLAWARLSAAASLLYANTAPTRELSALAREAADRALTLGPNEAASHAALAEYYRAVESRPERALESLQQARRLAPANAEILNRLAQVLRDLERDEESIAVLKQAERLDPRSASIFSSLGRGLINLRRYEEADAAFRRALALDPANPLSVEYRSLAALGRGDVAGARAAFAEGVPAIGERELAIWYTTYYELYWILDSAQQAMVVDATVDDFDGDIGSWGLALAQIYAAWGDSARSRAYADSARAGFAEQSAAAPDDGQVRVLDALSLAYQGRLDEAVRQGERGAALVPVSRSASLGRYVQEVLARVYVMAGRPEKAVEALRVVLSGPAILSRERLRVDPHFAPLHGHPAFQRLLEGKS